MNLARGRKKAEISEMFETDGASPVEEDILKPLQVCTIHKAAETPGKYHGRLLKGIPNLGR